MALADLNRSNDTPISTLKLAEITPKDWPTLPAAITGAMLTDANPNEKRPRYDSMTDWAGGQLAGEDPGLPTTANMPISTATVSLGTASGGAPAADYLPRDQQDKLLAGQVGVVDVGRSRGSVAPGQRYPQAGDAALAAPVVSSLAPNTIAHGTNPLTVVITGTGFSPYSRVITGGGIGSPWDKAALYISPTQMSIVIDPRSASAGTASVAVEDHGVLSNTNVNFTFT